MDENSQQLIDDCFLRPINDPRTSKNVALEPKPSKVPLKTELQVLRLSEDSQKMTMETLRGIHGEDFQLDDATKYKDKGGRMKKAYWQDRGTLLVQSISNFAQKPDDEKPDDPLRRFALLKLESYGFPPPHCIEAYDHCEGEIDAALELLFRYYMRVPPEPRISEFFSEEIENLELLDIREDEKAALKSIYDDAFEEKERNAVWSLKFKIDHLLIHSPSEVRKAHEAANAADGKKSTEKKKETQRCRNFDRDGTCKFGKKCRFAHVPPVEKDTSKQPSVVKPVVNEQDENWFYLEVRFPANTKYPYETPFTYLKTTCHDIPRIILLLIARHLYRNAAQSCADGVPCVYTISELLQMDERLSQDISEDRERFPDPEKSLFHVDLMAELAPSSVPLKELPSHYELGQTARGDGPERNAEQVQREDQKLMRRFLDIQRDEKYRKMMSARQKLPAFQKMIEVLSLIEESPVVVISGETGCGKSTQVPQFIIDSWLYQSSKLEKGAEMAHVEIVCTQPRRLSAIGVAERVAEERADRCGQIVGYQIRLENKISQSTRLTFCTTGILLRRLTSDPLLKSVTHVIVDEVHERSEESDFLLMILKDILKKRPELKVILMSATLNAALFSDYFGGAPVLDIPGRTFPVEQLFLEDILERCDYVVECDSQYSRKIKRSEEEELMRELEHADVNAEQVPPGRNIKDENLNLSAIFARYQGYMKKTCKSIYLMEPMRINPDLIESVLRHIVEGPHEWPKTGAILIFLPGLQEIQTVYEALCASSTFSPRVGKFDLIPLHSTLSSEEQAKVFRPAGKDRRKIVLSTNIAETSVTIEDCVFVLDCGLMKEKSFDSNRNMESLDLVWVSRANAQQRKGRAGRVMPGVCIHLFTGHRYHNQFLAQPVPEIHRVPLEQLILRIKTLPNLRDWNVLEVLGGTLEPPTEQNIIGAVTRLQDVGALDEEQDLTPLGHHLAALPVDVRIGKLMLFGAIFQCLDSVLTIAACLSHKSPFVCPFNKRAEAEKRKQSFAICNSDHLTCLVAYRKWLDVSRRSFSASRNYADENFLSLRTLQTISEVKYQFLELLVSIGFVPTNVPRRRKNAHDNVLELTGHELNVNGENNRLLVSILCAALYPNIVKILTPEKSFVRTAAGAMPKPATARDLRYKTREDGFVSVHPSSVNSQVAVFLSPFLVYQEKVKTSRIYIRECSMLPLVPLVLFAGSDLKIELHDGEFLFMLEDGWIILKAQNHAIAEMIQCMRLELQKLLEEKIRDPCLNLLHHANGCKIISNIVFLISNNN